MIRAKSLRSRPNGRTTAAKATAGTRNGSRMMIGRRNKGAIHPGLTSVTTVNATAKPITAAKYHTSGAPSTDTPDHAVEATKVNDRYTSTRLSSRMAATTYASVPASDVRSHARPASCTPKLYIARPATGTSASPVPAKATAAGRSLGALA
jgi:hypothetical protein